MSSRYGASVTQLRSRLARTAGSSHPHIVDIQWRLDYHVKSDSVEKLNTPSYFLRIKTKNPDGSDSSTEIHCSVEQLQDLVAKLQDATHSLNRLDLS
jgi:COMM domain containing 3